VLFIFLFVGLASISDKMKHMDRIFFVFLLFYSLLGWSQSKSSGAWDSTKGYFDYQKKAVNKEGSRWTLQEWLAQKERNRLMDLWLAMYAPSPYEFYVSGAYSSNQTAVGAAPPVSSTSYSGKLGAYAYVIGLGLEHENNWEDSRNDLTGTFNVRIMGNSVQGTHLILHYGNRDRNVRNGGSMVRFNQQFAGADLNLYLMKYFGLQALYRQYMPIDQAVLGHLEERRVEGGAFLDFWSFRVYGAWFQDTSWAGSGLTTKTGVQSGFYFFF